MESAELARVMRVHVQRVLTRRGPTAVSGLTRKVLTLGDQPELVA
ncbi:hypothetical protein [Streptomyces sp. NPDC005859]